MPGGRAEKRRILMKFKTLLAVAFLNPALAIGANSKGCSVPHDFFDTYDERMAELEQEIQYKRNHLGGGLHDRELDAIELHKVSKMFGVASGEIVTLVATGFKPNLVTTSISLAGSSLFGWSLFSSMGQEDKFKKVRKDYRQRHFSRKQLRYLEYQRSLLEGVRLAAEENPSKICSR